MVGDNAATADPAAKMPTPHKKVRLRPQMSVSLLPVIMNIAMISVKSVIEACTAVSVVARSWVMALIETLVRVLAKLETSWARAKGSKTAAPAAPTVGRASGDVVVSSRL